MNNDISIAFGQEIKLFESTISEIFISNIPLKNCRELASLLAIDYVNRLNSTPPVREYLNICAEKLTNYIGRKVITNDSFTTSMNLFTVAISPEQKVENHELSEKQARETALDVIIATTFNDIPANEVANLKDILKSMLSGKDTNEIFEFINNNREAFKALVQNSLKQKHKHDEMVFTLHANLLKAAKKHKENHTLGSNIRTLFSKITLAAGIAAIGSAGLVVGGLALPAILVPAIIGVNKIAGYVTDKTSDLIVQNHPTFKNNNNTIEQICYSTKIASHSRETKHDKSISQEEILEIQLDKNINISKIRDKDKQQSRGR